MTPPSALRILLGLCFPVAEMAAPERPDRRRPEHRAQRWPGTGADRERLASTFNSVAKTYQRARPDYPEELFGELIATTRLSPGDRVLEIGCATGKATLPLARRGFEITCIEPGPDLVVAARRNLVGLGAEVILGHFEDWDRDLAFDLVFAATAWQWVDPKVRYRKAWESLRRGGHLAFWDASHVFPDGGDPFFRELQEVYEEIGEGLPPDANPWPRPGAERTDGGADDGGPRRLGQDRPLGRGGEGRGRGPEEWAEQGGPPPGTRCQWEQVERSK